jgi:Bacterial membrane protein YfhO
MAKTTKSRIEIKEENKGLNKFNIDNLIPPKFHFLSAIIIILLLFLVFLSPMFFGGKTFQSGDILASKSMVPYIENHKDGFTLWNPLIFCGMPAYAIGTGYLWFNLIAVIFGSLKSLFGSFFSVEYARWTIYLIILGISSYMLMKSLTKNTLVSLFTGIAASFSTGIIVFLYIGHVTKLTSLCFYPLIFLLLLRFQKKILLLDFLILVITLQLFLQGFHAQIIFYIAFSVVIYYLYFLIRYLVNKEKENTINLVKSGLLVLAAVIIASLIQMDSFTQISEYTQYSTRGPKGIIENTAGGEDKSASDYYEYHTNWSFSPQEMLTFIVPSYFGFGNSTYKGPLTNDQAVDVNTYFGQMPFVDVAMYMGVLIFFLGLFAIITRWKEPFVQFLSILTGIALLISFGKNFPILFNILFYHLPSFDKFRVPSMILVIVQLNFPILAGLGVMKIIQIKEEKNLKLTKVIKNIAFLFTGIFVISILMNSAISSWFTERVTAYASTLQASKPQMAQQFTALADYSSGMFTGDFIIAFVILAAASWIAYLYLNSKFSKDIFVIALIVFASIDLWRIDSRATKYIDNPEINNMFDTPNYVNVIKKQNEKDPFRILNLKQDGSLGSFNNNSNYNAYFLLEDYYGYSGVKPRAYQDLIDVVGPVNETAWRMLNVKYIITNSAAQLPGFELISQSEKEYIYRNNLALPRAYFVNKVEYKSDIDVLNEIKANSFDPRNICYSNDKKFNVDVPDSTTFVGFTEYKDEKVSMNVNASGNNFLFLGNTYMTKGMNVAGLFSSELWKVYIDGNKSEIYKVNHGFMGIMVPKGIHKIEFIYNPTSFVVSKFIALILSSLVVLGLLITIIIQTMQKKKSLTITI